MTVRQYRALVSARNSATKPKKYRNKRVVVGDYAFDSKAEAARYFELMLLERAGIISELTVHPKFVLESSYYQMINGLKKMIPPVYYIADFSYKQDGSLVVEDVKSPSTAKQRVYLNKVKKFVQKYPSIVFIEQVAKYRGKKVTFTPTIRTFYSETIRAINEANS